MPDWTYQPLFRPLLLRLPAARARDLTLAALGRLGRAPGGLATIGFLGHMAPPASLSTEIAGICFPGPVGLGAGLDPRAQAFAALARFGFGFVEAGPVTVAPRPDRGVVRRTGPDTLTYTDLLANPGAAAVHAQLLSLGRLPVPLGIRLAVAPGTAPEVARQEIATLVRWLGPLADYLVLDLPVVWSLVSDVIWSASRWTELLATAVAEVRELEPRRPLFLRVPPGVADEQLTTRLGPALETGFSGVVVAGGVPAESAGGEDSAVADCTARCVGETTHAAAIDTVRSLRAGWSDQMTIIGSGGIMAPGHALDLLDAGANLVQVHSGLVFTGPGLPKRINEVVRWRAARARSVEAVGMQLDRARSVKSVTTVGHGRATPYWLGFWLMGALLIAGGAVAWLVGATLVVLPYDLAFLGHDRAALEAVNPRLLSFMAHDRISLAGTMISIGVLYMALAWYGIRRREHWAKRSVMLSAGVGLASFFLFVFHGYFDPLHFVQWIVALACFAVGSRWQAEAPPAVPRADLANDRAWRNGTVGQLLFVILGIGLVGGGAAIAALGSSVVFVPPDLVFMDTTPAALAAANPQLISLIAHDRAGFGGALVADGLAVLTLALWGFRRGARWVWWATAMAGLPGMAAGLGVHAAVGYLDVGHLAPAVLALALYVAGLAFSWEYLCGRTRPDEELITRSREGAKEERKSKLA